MEKERKQKPRGIRNNNPLNIVQTNDKWQGLREKQYDKRFCEYSPDLHHEIHDVEFQELLAQRVADKDDCLTT